MSRAENRHHRKRVITNRVRQIKVRWQVDDPKWILKTARHKTSPFTRCTCEGCTGNEEIKAENRRSRKAGRSAAKETE